MPLRPRYEARKTEIFLQSSRRAPCFQRRISPDARRLPSLPQLSRTSENNPIFTTQVPNLMIPLVCPGSFGTLAHRPRRITRTWCTRSGLHTLGGALPSAGGWPGLWRTPWTTAWGGTPSSTAAGREYRRASRNWGCRYGFAAIYYPLRSPLSGDSGLGSECLRLCELESFEEVLRFPIGFS